MSQRSSVEGERGSKKGEGKKSGYGICKGTLRRFALRLVLTTATIGDEHRRVPLCLFLRQVSKREPRVLFLEVTPVSALITKESPSLMSPSPIGQRNNILWSILLIALWLILCGYARIAKGT
jgi:hypothetical protein